MFQKSLQILVVCALLALAAIVGYALLRLHGPEDTLAEARAKFAAGNYGEVISDLTWAERGASFAGSPELREQLWRLRYEANSRLDNPQGALDDVRLLLQNGNADDEDLQLAEIRLLARAGKGEQARQRGREFVERNPEHSRGLELTGEACQTVYQPLLRELQATLERELGRSRREASRKALLAWLYRPSGDPEIVRARAALEQMFATEPRLVAVWPDIEAQALALRERIQEGLSFFQRSLDLGGEPVAAFRAMATAFEQSGRIDDLLFACEIQRRMFDHVYVDESGAWSAWARIQEDLQHAAIATVDRWLEADEVEARAAAGRLGAAAGHLALARALASWRLRDRQQIGRSMQLVLELRKAGQAALPALQVTQAGRLILADSSEPDRTEKILGNLVKPWLSEPPPLDRPDLAGEFLPLLLESLLARGAPEAEVLEVLDQWRAGRPEDAEPHVRTARYLLTLDRTAAALAALADAVAIAPQDPRLFELRVAISARHYEGTSQSGPSLFAQCVDHRKSRPDVEDPIGFVLCAQAAQSQPGGRAAIVAISSARAAIGAFPQANLPRQIELQALLAAARHDEAAKAADLAVRALQPDAITLGLAIQAKRAAGQSIREIVRIAMPKVPRTPSLQAELLRIALEDAPATSAQFVHEFLTAADAPLDWCVLAIRALVHQGETDRARQLLANAPAPADAEQRSALLTAFASWVEAQAAATADAELAPMAAGLRDRLALGEGAQQPLLAIAPRLADTHPATALELLERALPAALPHERTGALYALAGDLAAGQGDLVRAASRWLAALGFEDGVHVAEKLTRLLLLQEQEARAAKVYELVGRPTDPALAARMGRLPQAATLVAAQLQADPADLLVHATLATFGQFALVDWQAPTDPEVQNRRLELLSGLRDPALAELTLARADAMLRGDPSKQTHYLLLARATADAGLSAAASALHAQLFRAGLMNPVLLREVAYAGQRDDYVPDPKLDLKLMDAVSKGGTAGSQLTLAYGTARIVRGFEAGGFPDMARTTRLTQWLAAPQLQPWTDDDLELITTGHEPPQACYVLDRILAGPHAGDRDRLLRAFYRLAPRAIEASADSAGPLLVMAANHLQVDGARGEIVHFLLDQKSGEVPVDERAMLLAHVELVARGRDDGRLLDATVARLTAAIGVPRTAAAIDELLARYPTSLPMWALRTRLQSRLRNADVALGEMRSVLGHARDDRAELSFFALAAAERNLTDADVARLAELPKELRESPLGRYVQGLFALRLGDAATALSHFAAAAPQHDGRHLFFAALAELEVADGPSAPRAVELLTQLRRDYPSSSFARNVGSFVRQLSPR